MRPLHAFALGSTIFLASCATSPPLTPVTDRHTPIVGLGFEVLPPQGSDWYISLRTDKGVFYGKTLEKRPSNRTVAASVHDIAAPSPLPASRDEFARYVHDRMVRGETQGRFTLIKASASPGGAPGTFCADFANVIEERDNPFHPGIVLEMHNEGFECLDESSRFIVRGMFSERRPKGSPPVIDDALRAELKAFLASARTKPLLRGVPAADAGTPASTDAVLSTAEPSDTAATSVMISKDAAPNDGTALLPVVLLVRQGASETSSPTLTDAVRAAAHQRDRLRQATYASDTARTSRSLTIMLRFQSRVDWSSRPPLTGSISTVIVGSVIPWKCAASHTLQAVVLGADGSEVFRESASETESRLGAMMWCPDMTEPSPQLATKLADSMFAKIEQAGVLAARDVRR
jgi:hypothetical protein